MHDIVLHRESHELITGVRLDNYPATLWLHNPDLHLVVGVDPIYWDVQGDTVTPMTADERYVVDLRLVDNYRRIFNDMLWEACYNYNFSYFSGGVYSLILP
jgi:hypothetical protein